MTEWKKSYDIIHPPLVSSNGDDFVALSETMNPSNKSKSNGYQDSSIVETCTVEHNEASQEPVHRKAKVVSQVESKDSKSFERT